MTCETTSTITPIQGLSAAQAERLLREFGSNELPQAPRRGVGRILIGVLSEPMFLLLALAAAIYLLVGGIGEGLMMTGFAALSILLVVVQERRSENALAALRSLAAPMARVLRDGQALRIVARDVVPGDLLLVTDGERVAADALLRSAEGLLVDESLLTGESVPVGKSAAALEGGDVDRDSRTIYASTLIAAGRGVAQVIATGAQTEAGRIGVSLASIDTEPTLLQKSLGRLVQLFAGLALAASALVVLMYGLGRGQWLQGVLSGIALGMSTLPEEFPMVLAVFVALGARRLARLHVLARRTAVIEVLGACSTLCVDKTGTLTENRMRVATLACAGQTLSMQGDERPLPEPFAALLRVAAGASARSSNDPMDAAVHRLAADRDIDLPDAALSPEFEFGLSTQCAAVVRVWREMDGTRRAVAKGAPEAIADLCGLNDADRAALLADVERSASEGLRVLAVAASAMAEGPLPHAPQALGLKLQGLVAFADPIRATAAQAIAAARAAGISVAMITGDHPATALAIARQAGIDCSAPPLLGAQIDRASDTQLRELLGTTRIYARIRPQQKLRLVQAFKAKGEIVAMTGDGVNDAPALKAAHVGLAMGSRSTDVAREAAGIVLMEDDLRHLVAGIEMGRRIFDNLRKASIYIAAIHIPVAGLTLLPFFFGMPALLLPLHVVLVEMVIDPICAIAFENEPAEADTMRQPPRAPNDPPIGGAQLAIAVIPGLLLLAAVLAIYACALCGGLDAATARTLAFVALTAGNLMLVRVVGSRGATLSNLFSAGHGAYWTVAVLAAAVVAACITLPSLQHLFQFRLPTMQLVLGAVLAGVSCVLVFDLIKVLPPVQRVLGRRYAGA